MTAGRGPSGELVSVVIPAYNHEKYIGAAIRSILEQTYDQLELIVIDDGSSDHTFQVVKDLAPAAAGRLSRYHFETGPNRGVSSAAGRGFALARGAYVYVLDSDDVSKPGAIRRLYDALSPNPEYAVAVGDAEIIDGDSEKAAVDDDGRLDYGGPHATQGSFLRNGSHGVDFHSPEFGSYASLLLGNYIPNGFLIRKSAYEKVGGHRPDMPIEDWHIMLQLSKHYKMVFIDEILLSYRRHPTNTMLNAEWMLAGMAAVFQAETRFMETCRDARLKGIYNEVVAARTRTEILFSLGPFFEYSLEKFGLGAYYATRTRVFKILGFPVFRCRRVFAAGGGAAVPGPSE